MKTKIATTGLIALLATPAFASANPAINLQGSALEGSEVAIRARFEATRSWGKCKPQYRTYERRVKVDASGKFQILFNMAPRRSTFRTRRGEFKCKVAIKSFELAYFAPSNDRNTYMHSLFFNTNEHMDNAKLKRLSGLKCKIEEEAPGGSYQAIINKCKTKIGARTTGLKSFMFNPAKDVNIDRFEIEQKLLERIPVSEDNLAKVIQVGPTARIKLYKNKFGKIGSNSAIVLEGRYSDQGAPAGEYLADYGEEREDGSIYLTTIEKAPMYNSSLITLRIKPQGHMRHTISKCTNNPPADYNSAIEYLPGYFKDQKIFCFKAD